MKANAWRVGHDETENKLLGNISSSHARPQIGEFATL